MPAMPLESLSKAEIISRLTDMIRRQDDRVTELAELAATRLEDFHRVKMERDGLLNLCVRPGSESDDASFADQWIAVEEPVSGGGLFWPTKEAAESQVLKFAKESMYPRSSGSPPT